MLETAAKIFAERGYANATVQDVADALGMLKGSLYYYIETKEDLLFWLLSEVHDDVDAVLAEVEQVELEPIEKLRLYVRKSVEYSAKNLVKISIYYNDLDELSDERRKEILRRRKRHEDFVTSVISAAQEAGQASGSPDARLLGYCVFATIIWPYRWYRPRGRVKVDELTELCAEFVTHGVVGDTSR